MKSLIFRCSLALGITAGALSLVSCSDPGTTYLPANTVYVIASIATTSSTVQQFSIASASGSTVPTATLTLPSGYYSGSVATDVWGNIYVGAEDGNQPVILVYPPNASGTTAPTRTIQLTPATYAYALAIDTSGLVYVATQQSGQASPQVNVYAANSTGAATPIRTIQLTDFDPISGFAVDDEGDVYVSGAVSQQSTLGSLYAIAVYGPAASGDASPVRTILTSQTTYGIAADDIGDIYANMSQGANTTAFGLEEFAPTASGSSAVPTLTISLPLQSAVRAVGGSVQLDRTGNVFTSLGLVYSLTPPGAPVYYIYGYTPDSAANSNPGLSFTPSGGIGQVFAVN